jgi:hypothetical protein
MYSLATLLHGPLVGLIKRPVTTVVTLDDLTGQEIILFLWI